MFEETKHLKLPKYPLARNKVLEDIGHFFEGDSLSISGVCHWPGWRGQTQYYSDSVALMSTYNTITVTEYFRHLWTNILVHNHYEVSSNLQTVWFTRYLENIFGDPSDLLMGICQIDDEIPICASLRVYPEIGWRKSETRWLTEGPGQKECTVILHCVCWLSTFCGD